MHVPIIAITTLFLKLDSVRTLDSASDNARAAASSDQTSQCLASVNTLGLEHENNFQWRGSDGISHTGTCHGVRTSFDLCSKSPPRECLLARVPWQTALGTARCCFHCCMHYWQDALGLSDIYRHWFENPDLNGWNYHAGYGKPGGNMIPDLNSVVMQVNSVKRFSLFMWNAKSDGQELLNATHLVQENGGGGAVWSHGDAAHPFEDHVNDYVTSHPVSVIYQSDSWKPHYPFARLKADSKKDRFPTGGHYYTINSIEDTGPVVGIPLGVMTAHFEGHLGNHAQNRDRKSLLMCCCMTTHMARGDRIRALHRLSGGVCNDQIGVKAPPDEYVQRLTDSKFSLSPVGMGKQCFRDTEIIVAGGVAVLDANHSGGPGLYDHNMPVLHVPICKQNYCDMHTMTKSWFESEYAKLEARRDELTVSKSFWPYWLYHVFSQVPARPNRQGSAEST